MIPEQSYLIAGSEQVSRKSEAEVLDQTVEKTHQYHHHSLKGPPRINDNIVRSVFKRYTDVVGWLETTCIQCASDGHGILRDRETKIFVT